MHSRAWADVLEVRCLDECQRACLALALLLEELL